jgi:ABC-2 type transport system permease protein
MTSLAQASMAKEERITPARVANSEWIKLRSLRSTVWLVAASVAALVGVAVLFSSVALANLEGGHGLGVTSPAIISLYGVYLAQLTYGVLGVLLITGEYTTGMIRATLTAVPRRLPVLWAKLAAFAVVAFGFILRNTAGAIVTLFGIMLVLPALGIVLPASVGRHILPYLPSNAGQAVMQVHPNGNMLAPWTGFALYVGYTAVAVVAAALLLRRRDA